ncbi:MAG: class B sortase [Burkholderiales bacterium]
MVRPLHHDNTNGKKRLKWIYDSQAKTARLAKVAVSVAAIVIGIIIFLICVYIIIPSIISDASDTIDKNFALRLYESTLINPPADGKAEQAFGQPAENGRKAEPRVCFGAALAENPDIVGRIAIENIGITYLVTQTQDNEHYLKTGYGGDSSRLGTVFLDYRCDAHNVPLKGHYILYGHSFADGGLFYNLKRYKDKDTFYNERIIRFDTLYADYEWEVFSAYTTDIGFNFIKTDFENGKEWLKFLKEIQRKSMFKTDTVLSPDDALLTLCTCVSGAENERFVVHARLTAQ